MEKLFALSLVLGAATFGQAAVVFQEDFDNVAGLSGWQNVNNSDAPGPNSWFQGNNVIFPQHSTTGYAAANYNATTGANEISVWLTTPTILVDNTYQLSFWTRTVELAAFADSLEVRMATAGTSVGSTATSVGDYTNLMAHINPGLTLTGYPEAWTNYVVTVTGLSGPTNVSFGFRYHVPNGGPEGSNSDYIGLDSVTVITPEPASMAVIGLGMAAMARRRKRN